MIFFINCDKPLLPFFDCVYLLACNPGPNASQTKTQGKRGNTNPFFTMATRETGQKVGERDNSDFKKFTVVQLRAFLKDRNVRSSGNKPALIELAELYKWHPVVKQTETATRNGDLFKDEALQWSEIRADSQVSVPAAFNIDTLAIYLRSVSVSLSSVAPSEDRAGQENESSEEEVYNAGTEKPVVKGRRMYLSEKLTFAETARASTHILFRGNCAASYKKLSRFPAVALSLSGEVVDSRCACEAGADGRCCHVAVLLYLIESLSMKMPAKMTVPCTSQPQSWGKGSNQKRDPQPIYCDR
jgi:hypothetical protein